jgi:hypothetical protein
MHFLRLIISGIVASLALGEKCCEGSCVEEGLEKYYSIAQSITGKLNCGECCMRY